MERVSNKETKALRIEIRAQRDITVELAAAVTRTAAQMVRYHELVVFNPKNQLYLPF